MDDLVSYVNFPNEGQKDMFKKYAEKLAKLDALPIEERVGKVLGKLSGYTNPPYYISGNALCELGVIE
jgi:hypothetical protein